MMIERGSIEFIVIHVNQEEIIEQLRIREKLLQRRGLLIVKGCIVVSIVTNINSIKTYYNEQNCLHYYHVHTYTTTQLHQ